MALPVLLTGWLLVTVWFGAWHAIARRRSVSAMVAGALEALVVTLVAGLWFASLGHGGWYLLFPLLGGLVELSPRLRTGITLPMEWLGMAAGVVRLTVAGGLLAWWF